MRKIFYRVSVALCAAALFASCSSIRHTSTTEPVDTRIYSMNKADLKVSDQKISYIFVPSKANRRAGEKAVISTAVAEALKANGNADVLVGFQYEIKKTKNFFGKVNIKYVKVVGYPATYQNFHPMEECQKAPCPTKCPNKK